jgi:hydrogenase maturation factor HypF (carbamoyltransferase family)
MNNVEFFAAKYTHADLPPYRLQNHHYWFDIDNGMRKSSKYDIELTVENKSDVILSSFYGSITNIKVYDMYVDSISEILQMYPTNSNLLINDTARKIVDMNGLTTS